MKRILPFIVALVVAFVVWRAADEVEERGDEESWESDDEDEEGRRQKVEILKQTRTSTVRPRSIQQKYPCGLCKALL